MRITIISMTLAALAACAGQPPSPSPAPNPHYLSNAKVITAPATDKETIDRTVLQAKRMGYTVVTENGEQLFCHKVAQTGSHLAMETTCLTAKEMEDLRLETQRRLQSFQMQTPPPQGH